MINKKLLVGLITLNVIVILIIILIINSLIANNFYGFFRSSRRTADEQQAKNIERAMITFGYETGEFNILQNTDRFKVEPDENAENAFSGKGDHQSVMELIVALQSPIYVFDEKAQEWKSYGPYLANRREDEKPQYSNYAPQWNPHRGGKRIGYNIKIYPDTQLVEVRPAVTEKTLGIYVPENPYDDGNDYSDSRIEIIK